MGLGFQPLRIWMWVLLQTTIQTENLDMGTITDEDTD